MYKKLFVEAAALLLFTCISYADNGRLGLKWICDESVNGTVVLDGAKMLTISQDLPGTYSIHLVQKDQFSGDQTLVHSLPVKMQDCDGFSACERFIGYAFGTQVALEFFVNVVPTVSYQDAHLELKGLSSDFICKDPGGKVL